MTPIQSRKAELLVTSAINREVLRLEARYLRRGASWLKPEGLIRGNMKLFLPLVPLLAAWAFRRAPASVRGSLALLGLRKVWEAFAHSRRDNERKA